MFNTDKIQKPKGFSLLELILAVAIFSLGSVALGTLIIDANLTTKSAIDRTEALFYAREGLEAVRAIRDESWASIEDDGDYGLDDDSDVWVLTGSPDVIDDKYTRTISIAAQGAMKIITSTVTWELRPSHTSSVVLNTLLTNW